MTAVTPAGLALLGAGLSGRSLARDLGVTPQAVSFQLAGKSAETSPELLARIAELRGPELADQIRALIEEARARDPRKAPA